MHIATSKIYKDMTNFQLFDLKTLVEFREKPLFLENHPTLEMFFLSSENPLCCFYNHFIPVHFPYVNGALGTYLIFSIHITHEGT